MQLLFTEGVEEEGSRLGGVIKGTKVNYFPRSLISKINSLCPLVGHFKRKTAEIFNCFFFFFFSPQWRLPNPYILTP